MRRSLSTTSRSGGSMRRRACAALAGVLAAILPAWRASKLNILNAIADD